MTCSPCIQIAAALLVAWATSSCTTTIERAPAGIDRARPMRAERAEAWTVHTAGEPCGTVVRFLESGPQGRSIYVVRNEYGQDLGFVDELGRAWRRHVHESESELVGTGPLLIGVLRVLGRADDAAPELVPSPANAAVAPARAADWLNPDRGESR